MVLVEYMHLSFSPFWFICELGINLVIGKTIYLFSY